MKVYEIIAKEPLNEFSLKDLNPFNWGKGNEKSDTLGKAGGRSTVAGGVVGGGIAATGTAAMMWNTIGKAADKGAREAVKAKWVKGLGTFATVLKILQAFEICAETKYRLYVLEQRYIAGELNKQQFADYEKAFLGLAEIQFFTPWLVDLLANTKLVMILARVIWGAVTLGVGFFTGGFTAIMGLAIETAIFTALETFLRSQAFENWMFNHCLNYLIMAGEIPYQSWSLLRQLLSEIPILGKYIDSGGHPGMGYADAMAATKKEKNPKAAEDDEKVTDFGKINRPEDNPNAVFIDGNNIVGADGKLDDRMMMKPDVQIYIKQHPNDPNVKKIASIPRGPNSIY